MPNFSIKSRTKLSTCHPDLQSLMNEVIKHIDCVILCGVRTLEEQQAAFKAGNSKCDGIHNKSKHQAHEDGYSWAVDVAPFPIDWDDAQRFKDLAKVIMDIAAKLHESGIMKHKLVWGGTFKSLVDLPHYELVA